MPTLTIGGVPLVPDRAELRRLLCKPRCVGSVLFTFAVSVCIVLSPAWRESLRLQRIELEQQVKVDRPTGVEHTGARASPPPLHTLSTPEALVGEEVAGGVLTAVLYHDVLHEKSRGQKQGSFPVRFCRQLPCVAVTPRKLQGLLLMIMSTCVVVAGAAVTASAQLPSIRVTHCEIEGPHATLATLQRDYLAAVRTSVLRKRAAQLVGADDQRIEQADDADDVRSESGCLVMHRSHH